MQPGRGVVITAPSSVIRNKFCMQLYYGVQVTVSVIRNSDVVRYSDVIICMETAVGTCVTRPMKIARILLQSNSRCKYYKDNTT